jgi:cation diffusion facilitator family transporter
MPGGGDGQGFEARNMSSVSTRPATAGKPGADERARAEERALKVSGGGALLLAVLGIAFAIQSGSEAILLDGVFSGLGFVMALVTLKVSRLVRRPDDDVFQFGYAHFAPLINVIKSLMMTLLCVFAGISALVTLVDGGQPLAVGSALLYAVLATLIGIGLFFYLSGAARRSASPLVVLDAKAARMDMFLSAIVLISFVLGWLAMGTELSPWVVYLDPGLVLLLCILVLPVPLKILWENGREALLLAPDVELQQSVRSVIREALQDFPVEDHRLRMLKLGNVLAVTLHLQPAASLRIESVRDLDRVRFAIEEALAALDYDVGLNVIFVENMELAR